MDKKLSIPSGKDITPNPDKGIFDIANQDVINVLSKTTDYLIENREVITQKYGGKTYGILLAQSMGCNVPQFFPIPTDFVNNNSQNINVDDLERFNSILNLLSNFGPNKEINPEIQKYIVKFSGGFTGRIVTKTEFSHSDINAGQEWLVFNPGSQVNPLGDKLATENEFVVYNQNGGYTYLSYKKFKSDILKDFLLSNVAVLKHVLNDLNEDNLFDKYSFLLDILTEQFGGYSYEIYDLNGYNGLKKCMRVKSYEGNMVYDLGSDDEFFYGGDISSYIIDKIILGLGLVKYKTSQEIDEEVNRAYESSGSYDGGFLRGRIESDAFKYNSTQVQDFLGIFNENTNFSSEQIQYLKDIFSKFKDYPFISVRSSANIEDGGDKSYAGTFYTGFCSTRDFDLFLHEVKKVLASSTNINQKGVKMGITIMAVLGKVNHKKSQEEIDFINVIYHDSPIGRQLVLQNEERYYYPEGGGVMLTNTFSGRVSISSEFGLPVGITAGKGKGFHHDFNADGTLTQARIQEYSSHDYERPEYIKGFHSATDSIYEITNYNLRAHTLKRLGNHTDLYGAFSLKTYQELVKIGKELEYKLGYPLDIEFVVHDGKPYIIQLRPYVNKYKKPEGFEYPDLEGKEIILDDKSGDIVYCMGYLKEDSLKVVKLEPKVRDVGTDTRDPNKKYILEELNRLEKIGTSYLLYIEDYLSVFPEINKLEFPNFKGVSFLGEETTIASHISMMLRQNEIPTICISRRNPNLYLSDGDNVGVFIDGEKGESIIYK